MNNIGILRCDDDSELSGERVVLHMLVGASTVLPSQFFEGRSFDNAPEERLAWAVLSDAVRHFQKYCFSQAKDAPLLFAEAMAYIFSNNRAWPYSFLNLCDALHVNSAYLQQGLMLWLKQQGVRG